MNEWRQWAYMIGAIAQTLFVLTFITSMGWWRDFVGRALLLKSFMLMTVFDVIVVAIFFPFAHQDEVFTFLIWGVTLAIIYQLSALIRQRFFMHRKFGNKKKKEVEDDEVRSA
jgi:hypothetical protein